MILGNQTTNKIKVSETCKLICSSEKNPKSINTQSVNNKCTNNTTKYKIELTAEFQENPSKLCYLKITRGCRRNVRGKSRKNLAKNAFKTFSISWQ